MKFHSYARLGLGLLSAATLSQATNLKNPVYRPRYSVTTENFIEKYLSAVMHGDLQTVQTYSKLIDVNLITDAHYGMNPLHWAAALGHTQIARCLILHGAQVNTPTPQGYTPLHLAAFSGHLDLVKCLVLEGNCQVNARMASGLTALDLAIGRKNKALEAFLKSHQSSTRNHRFAIKLPQNILFLDR